MGIKKAITFTILGVGAFEWAAYKTGNSGLGSLVSDIFGSSGFGESVDLMINLFGEYAKDFFYDLPSAIGTLGQTSMYGGLGKIVYDLSKKIWKNPPEEAGQSPQE